MATGRRYYWIKLKESFMTSDAVDFLMGQKDGANYVVLYQMLCLKTINTGGKLERHIGEVIIPYDEAKIQRDTKWFTLDTVRVALNLYKALGLIYIDKNGTLTLANYENLVGSETDWAEKRRRQRGELPAPAELPGGDIVPSNVPTNVPQNVPIDIDIRDKDIEIRDQSIDKEDKEKEVLTKPNGFVCRTKDVRLVIDAWNSLGLQKIQKILPDTNRGAMLRKRINDYGVQTVLDAIEKVRSSAFLMGGNGKGWTATFDWFIRPNNFPKVLDGNYDEARHVAGENKVAADLHESYRMMEDWANGQN